MASQTIESADPDGVPAGICPFFSSDWKPSEYRQLTHDKHRAALHGLGYFIVKGFFSDGTITELDALYRKHDHVGVNDLGMFVSAYSPDIAYRKEIHKRIGEIIEPELNAIFSSFKPILYNFVIKESRPGKSLPLHQDLALIDENTASSINIWVTMMDSSMESGPVCLVPKTQYFFPPFRSHFTELDITAIDDHLKEYAIIPPLEKGDLLVFDSRLIHGSIPNTSGKNRVAAVGHICPDDAQFTMIVKSPGDNKNEFDVIEFEREDLFQAKGYETADKTDFHGNLKTRIISSHANVNESQIHDYFKGVGVPRTNILDAKPEGESHKKQQSGFSEWIKGLFG